MDVVVDTDILSTFAKVNKVKLLPRLFRKSAMLICPSVSAEIQKGIEKVAKMSVHIEGA